MRKFLTLLTLIVLAAMIAVPVMAQDRPALADFLTEDGRFGTLLAAIDAAGLTDALAAEGPITVLAPTDDAFAALPIGTVDYLLANPDLLTAVLTAHVIPGEAYTLRSVAGGATVDALSGDSLTFALADGALTVNGIAITSVDKLVANGVVHIIDGVIVPASVAEALQAKVRVAHFSPDAGPVDIALDGERVLEGVTFGTVSNWLSVNSDAYTIDVFSAGGENPVRTVTTRLPVGARITVAARGVFDAGDFALQFIPEDYSPLSDGQARVTVFHAIQYAPAVDVLANGAVLIGNLGYPGTLGNNDGVDSLTVSAGTYSLQVVPAGAAEPVLINLPNARLEANTYYFVAAIGTPTNPRGVVVATSADGE